MERFESVGQCDLYQGDCLSVMPWLPSGSVDMILCDLPYGTTACKWDTVIPFEPLWEQYKRLIKPNGAIVLFGSQPFTSALVMSNVAWFRHGWVWNKRFASNFTLAKYQPLKVHEDIVVFSRDAAIYIPQKTVRDAPIKLGKNCAKKGSANLAAAHEEYAGKVYMDKNPESILLYSNRAEGQVRAHPTQKPVALCEYLIKTYTNEGMTVLDNCAGSFTTGVAALNAGRKFIGIEQDAGYFDIGVERMKVRMAEVVLTQNPLFSYDMTGRDTQDLKSDSPLLA